MDAKYLAEIKEDYDEYAGTGSIDDAFDLAHQIPALLAEVERLTEENAALQAANDKMVAQNKRILSRELDKDQQIATLKRTLEIANITIQKLSGESYEYSTSSFQAQEQEAHHVE